MACISGIVPENTGRLAGKEYVLKIQLIVKVVLKYKITEES